MTLIALLLTFTTFFSTPPADSVSAKPFSSADTVVYHFGDASVAPQYHRSYTITVTRSEAKLVVESYGKELAAETVKVSKAQFKQIIAALDSARIRKAKTVVDNDGCTGGTSETIKAMKGSATLFDARVYHCGRKDYGELAGDTAAVKRKMRALFPDIEDRLK